MKIIEHLYKNRALSLLLILLISGDILFIGLHIFHKLFSGNAALAYFIENDKGYAEFYQYLKELWIILLLLIMSYKTKQFGFISWALLFFYLLMDDALSLHENLGFLVSEMMTYKPRLGLRPEDFGELIVTFVAAVVLLSIISPFYYRGKKIFKVISQDLFFLLIILLFFGVIVDMIHIIIHIRGVGTIEDGGEMVTMSLIVSYVFYTILVNKNPHLSVLQYIFSFKKDNYKKLVNNSTIDL